MYTSTLFTTGNMGIGTSTTVQTLTVNGSIGTNQPLYLTNQAMTNTNQIQFNNSNAASTIFTIQQVDNAGANYLRAGRNGYGDIVVNSSGNVGIGTNAPSALLHVNGGNITVNYGNTIGVHQTYASGGSYSIGGAGNNLRIALNSDTTTHRLLDIGYYTGDVTTGTWNSKMVVDPITGNVGIGTASPSYVLDVNGITQVRSAFYVASNSATNGWVTLQPISDTIHCGYTEYKIAGTRYGYIGYMTTLGGSNCLDYHSENGWGMDFNANGNLAILISSSGTVMVGGGYGGFAASYAPQALFTINSNYTNGNTGGFCINAQDSNSSTSNYKFMMYPFVQASSQVAYNTQVTNNGTTYNSLCHGYNGYVGINNTSPSYVLHVGGDAYASGSLIFGSGGTYQSGAIFSNSSWGCIIRAYTGYTGVTPGDLNGATFLFSDVNDHHRLYLCNNGDMVLDPSYGREIIVPAINGYGQFRACAGSYGFMIRNDGSQTYFLLTAANDKYGSWNGLRPWYVDNNSGYIHMNNGAVVYSGLTTDSFTVSGSPIQTSLQNATGTAYSSFTLPSGAGMYYVYFHYGNPPQNFPSSVYQVFYDGGYTNAQYTLLFTANGSQYGTITSTSGATITFSNGGAWWGWNVAQYLFYRITKIC